MQNLMADTTMRKTIGNLGGNPNPNAGDDRQS